MFVVESGLVKRQPLCRLHVLGYFKKLVGARHVLIVPGSLACWADQLSSGRTGICADALLFLLAPCAQGQKAPDNVAGNRLQ